jgi:DNA-binding CsgD family transcriptional regulator
MTSKHLCSDCGVQVERKDMSHLLSPREHEVIALVAKGFGNKAIAASLCISKHSVSAYLKRIFDKVAASNRAEAAVWWVMHCPQTANKGNPAES